MIMEDDIREIHAEIHSLVEGGSQKSHRVRSCRTIEDEVVQYNRSHCVRKAVEATRVMENRLAVGVDEAIKADASNRTL